MNGLKVLQPGQFPPPCPRATPPHARSDTLTEPLYPLHLAGSTEPMATAPGDIESTVQDAVQAVPQTPSEMPRTASMGTMSATAAAVFVACSVIAPWFITKNQEMGGSTATSAAAFPVATSSYADVAAFSVPTGQPSALVPGPANISARVSADPVPPSIPDATTSYPRELSFGANVSDTTMSARSVGAVQSAPSVDPSTESTSVGGSSASGGAVANPPSVVAGMAAGFRRCYNDGLEEDPHMKGSVRVTVRIGQNGEVLSASASGGDGLSRSVVSCVQARVAAAQFAPPEGGGAIIVIPVTFVPR
jgi:hypothetical protein